MDEERLEQLAQVAVWYFEDGIDQHTIAERIGLSRSMVSRMLSEARKMGIVTFRVDYPLHRDRESEQVLEQLFGLDQAWVLSATPWSDEPSRTRILGKLVARCLQSRLFDGIRIGVGVGYGVLEVIRAMPSLELRQAAVVQLIGTLSSKQTEIDSAELTRLLSEKLHAESLHLPSPAIISSRATAQSLLHERSIQQALDAAINVDVALIGIGSLAAERSSLVAVGVLSREELEALTRAGAVADLLWHYVDGTGEEVTASRERHVIGIPLPALREIPSVIAVAAGSESVDSIRAALRGRYVDVLVTDEETSRELIEREAPGYISARRCRGRRM